MVTHNAEEVVAVAEQSERGGGAAVPCEAERGLLPQELLAALLAGAGEGVILLDAAWRVVYLNPAAERLLSKPRDELIGHTFWARMPELAGSLVESELQQAMHDRRPTTFEAFLAQARVWATIRAQPHPQGLLVYCVDSTERKKADAECQRLLEENQRQRAQAEALISATPDGLVAYGPDGEALEMNPTAREMLTYSPAECELLGLEKGAVIAFRGPQGELVPAEETPPQRALRGETVRGAILATPERPGRPSIWLSVSAAPVRTPEGGLIGAVATYTDITPIYQLSTQREAMLRAISEDLRTPLTALLGHAERLRRVLDRAGLTGAEHDIAMAILADGRRLNDMLQDLVDSARWEAGELGLTPMPIDLYHFLLDLRQHEQEGLEMARVRLEVAEGLPTCAADPDRLERILVNLLRNAMRRAAPDTEVIVRVARQGREVICSVTSQGPGIAPEELPHLFERYYERLGTERRGEAAGLYVSKALVEAHGGRIWVENEPGRHSTFHLALPAA